MADEDVESIGGISVSIGASHAQLVSDLDRADQLLEAWAKQKFTVQIGANVNLAQGGGGRPAAVPTAAPIVIGPRATTAVQAQQGQTSFQRAIQEQLAKTGERLDENGEIVSATTAKVQRQKAVLVETQAVAAQPTALNIETGALQNDLKEILSTLQAIVATTKEVSALPAPRAATGGAQAPRAARSTEFPPLEETRGGGRESATFAPQLTQARRAEIEKERAKTAAAVRTAVIVPTAAVVAVPPVDDIERERQRRLAALESRAGAGRAGGLNEEDIERREQQRVAAAESSRVAQGRTARTTASGFGGQFLFGGVGRQQTEAVAAQAAAESKLNIARRRLNDPAVIRDARAYRAATEEVTVAQNELAKTTERVRSLSGPLTAVKSLAAVTVAGAAFGLGLKAIDVALDLTGRALTPVIDRMTGFGTVSARVVDTLSDQTRQAQGNAEAVVALSAAQAGLSKSAASVVQPLVTQQAQIEASNKSMGEAVDLFQTYTKLREQGGAGGITSQTGGFLGTGFFGTRSTSQELGRLFGGLPANVPGASGPQARAQRLALGVNPSASALANLSAEQNRNLSIFNDGLKFANDQLVKGGDAVHKFVTGLSDTDLQKSLDAFAAAGADSTLLDALRGQKIGVAGLGGVGDADTANRILQALNAGFAQQDPSLLLAQFNRQIPAIIAGAARQLQFATGTQQPAQFALQGLTNPNVAVGTGIAAQDQAQVVDSLKEANSLQDQLNARYDEGKQIIQDTYRPSIVRNFGAAAATSFDTALAAVESTGKQIASIQESISNEQAAYQVAQYNFQLTIAKRTLSDIAGLNNADYGVGQSKLGILERQNLQLSRQGQQLQFALSQRQINFQTAVAGFSAPGVTPEERQANIAEAKLEASYAQKQLDIQRQMFGNQVQIVDISNLLQGRDLVKQIGLLQQGRKVTVDTAAYEQQLMRLNQLQSQNVTKVGTYLGAVDGLVVTAMGFIQQLEAAAGQAMVGLAADVLGQFGIFINGLATAIGGAGAGYSGTGGHEQGQGGLGGYASGVVATVGTPTRIGDRGVMGEAGDETLIILSRPRTGTSGAGGGSTLVINFNGPVNANNRNDLDYITRSVMQAMGKQGSLVGLRSGG